ncbi:MAG: type ISP restriction/modification enzyme [Myxococcota bacterium]
MATDHRSRLREIRTFRQLVAYLRDEMDWPIDSEDFEDLTFDYTPEELGIDAKNAAKIQEIKRLRPLSPNQPWGIFFVKFEPKHLPVVAMRRILSQVALKKRASANKAERQAWAADDLLFVSNYGEGDERRITFAHFSKARDGHDLPTLKVLGWDNLDTPLHLDDVAEKLTHDLAWPDDDADAGAWRERWRAAFTLRHREVVATARDLSLRLADLGRDIRDRIKSALAIETETGPLTKLMKAFQEALVHDLDAAGFADMYAQTIAYGLLSARIADPRKKTVDDFAAHMRTNPFLKELMETFLRVGGRRGKAGGPGIDFDELGVSEVVELLDDANMEAVVRDFGDRNPQEDPVIHFYEHFLAAYDKKQKVQRGIFYTPRPVVSYIVRSVDGLLRTEFGLEDGLADTTTWGQMASRHKDLKIPEGVSPDQAFVQILDPATGTGTFLVEVIDLIHKRMVEKWKTHGHGERKVRALWNEYVPKYLLPRLHGYELLMAPYAIAHLKIGLKLYETGYLFGSDERARIYLTNALEPAHDFSGTLEFAIPALAHEAEAVNEIKRKQCFTSVIGNPPYANYSANLSPQARRIVDKYRNFAGNAIRERNQLQFERNIQDDFVKFISIGEDQIQAANIGVLSYITNATMLASASLRGLREHIAHWFSTIFEMNLHGGVNEIIVGVEDDENIFDIAQSVAIHVYVRSMPGGSQTISYCDLLGRRTGKYAALASQTVGSTEWKPVQPDSENCSFLPQDAASGDTLRRLDSTFVRFGAGIKTNRDTVVIGFDDDSLLEAVRKFQPKLVSDKHYRKHIHSLLYRPFDIRRIFYHEDVVASRSLPTMEHIVAGPNIGLVASSTWTTPERFSVNVSRLMVEMKAGTHDRGTTFLPLYRYESLMRGKAERVHNLTQDFVNEWTTVTGTRFVPTGRGDFETTSGPEDVLFWFFGLFHSPEYRRRYRAALAQGFPLVLLSSNKRLLREVTRLGGELVLLHLMESPRLENQLTRFVGSRNPAVEKVSWSRDTVWLDKAQTCGFRGVPKEVWDFHVGGYQVCEKWLKDRRATGGKNPSGGRVLTDEDIAHYEKIVVALNETIRIMQEIDGVIQAHGGWPDAFRTADAKSDTAPVVRFRPRIVQPRREDRYVTCVPLVPLEAAAGAFSDPQHLEDDKWEWVEIDSKHRLRGGMFVAHVVGHSMEPKIADGSYCLFRAPVEGSRQGKILLVQHHDIHDPETGGSFTVKRYSSEKVTNPDGTWRHTKVTLSPLNPEYEPIVLTPDSEDEVRVIAEWVQVL